MKRWAFRVVVMLGACAALGWLVATLGLVSISASTEHWAPAKWFLHYVMRESVQTQSDDVEPPMLDDPRRLRLGAAAYALNCAHCHGAPGQPAELWALRMTPPAPDLNQASTLWKPNELHWIALHGIKYTAMPAWPAESRGDEVWTVVAFLRALPQLDDEHYRALAMDHPAPRFPPANDLRACMACHGRDGAGRDGTAPVLAGQHVEVLRGALLDYAAGRRASGIMQPLARQLGTTDIDALSRSFAAMPAMSRTSLTDPASRARGEQLALRGDPAKRVAACAACHGRDGALPPSHYPVLHGQNQHDLVTQLDLFRNGIRAGTAQARVMVSALGQIDDAQARDVAAYYHGARRALP